MSAAARAAAASVAPDHPGRLVLLGHPVAHSLSPTFQNAALRRLGSPLVYEALDVPPAALAERLVALIAERAAGNATVPHKEALFARCARRTAVAERAGAVNTFWTERGALVGDNTDVAGVRALFRHVGADPDAPSRVALLGAGGAAAAVCAALEARGAEVRVATRRPERAAALAARFPALVRSTRSPDDALAGADVVVNATPLGLRPDDPLPVAPERISPAAVVVDLVYGADETPWVRAARAAGLRAADGLVMLVEQGAAAFERWLDAPPDRAAMWAAVAAHTGRSVSGTSAVVAAAGQGGAADR